MKKRSLQQLFFFLIILVTMPTFAFASHIESTQLGNSASSIQISSVVSSDVSAEVSSFAQAIASTTTSSLSSISQVLELSGMTLTQELNMPNTESENTPEIDRFTPIPFSSSTTVERMNIEQFMRMEALDRPSERSRNMNLILNPSFETEAEDGTPLHWLRGGYGENIRHLSFPVEGRNGGNAARVTLSGLVDGDVKWYFEPISVETGQYQYADFYRSNSTNHLVVRLGYADGSYTYRDLAELEPSAQFKKAEVQFYVPSDATNVTMFHLLRVEGELDIDDASLVRLSSKSQGRKDRFSEGAVSITLDDAWKSQIDNAAPLLNDRDLKATFFISTRQLADYGFPSMMSTDDLLTLSQQGHEIGAHTRTHPHLTELSPEEQEEEILGSLNDLRELGIPNVNNFAYPYGDYNDTTIEKVKGSGYKSARSTIPGYVRPSSDRFQIAHFSVEDTTTFAQMRAAAERAKTNDTWIIFTFHQIDHSGGQYSMTPERFEEFLDYLVDSGIRVVTVEDGLTKLL